MSDQQYIPLPEIETIELQELDRWLIFEGQFERTPELDHNYRGLPVLVWCKLNGEGIGFTERRFTTVEGVEIASPDSGFKHVRVGAFMTEHYASPPEADESRPDTA
jgi:hypothetical protein